MPSLEFQIQPHPLDQRCPSSVTECSSGDWIISRSAASLVCILRLPFIAFLGKIHCFLGLKSLFFLDFFLGLLKYTLKLFFLKGCMESNLEFLHIWRCLCFTLGYVWVQNSNWKIMASRFLKDSLCYPIVSSVTDEKSGVAVVLSPL